MPGGHTRSGLRQRVMMIDFKWAAYTLSCVCQVSSLNSTTQHTGIPFSVLYFLPFIPIHQQDTLAITFFLYIVSFLSSKIPPVFPFFPSTIFPLPSPSFSLSLYSPPIPPFFPSTLPLTSFLYYQIPPYPSLFPKKIVHHILPLLSLPDTSLIPLPPSLPLSLSLQRLPLPYLILASL